MITQKIASQDRLEKALQALHNARRLQCERLMGVEQINPDGEDVKNDLQKKWDEDEDKLSQTNQPKSRQVELKENENSSDTVSILNPQQQESQTRVEMWLQAHPEAEAVRTQYLTLIERRGTKQQQQSCIAQTAIWLEAHPDAASVREQYLILIGKVGTIEQQQSCIAQTVTWLKEHPEAKYVRIQYDALIEKQESAAFSRGVGFVKS